MDGDSPTPASINSISPVCTPPRTTRPIDPTVSVIAPAQRTARAGPDTATVKLQARRPGQQRCHPVASRSQRVRPRPRQGRGIATLPPSRMAQPGPRSPTVGGSGRGRRGRARARTDGRTSAISARRRRREPPTSMHLLLPRQASLERSLCCSSRASVGRIFRQPVRVRHTARGDQHARGFGDNAGFAGEPKRAALDGELARSLRVAVDQD